MPSKQRPPTDTTSRGQRALWSFLGATLIGPFVASVLAILGSLLLSASKLGIGSTLGSLDIIAPALARHAVDLYVWAAMPAAMTGAVCATWLIRRAELPWMVPAIAAGVMTTLANAFTRLTPNITAATFIAALSAVIVWALLRRAGILPQDPPTSNPVRR